MACYIVFFTVGSGSVNLPWSEILVQERITESERSVAEGALSKPIRWKKEGRRYRYAGGCRILVFGGYDGAAFLTAR